MEEEEGELKPPKDFRSRHPIPVELEFFKRGRRGVGVGKTLNRIFDPDKFRGIARRNKSVSLLDFD